MASNVLAEASDAEVEAVFNIAHKQFNVENPSPTLLVSILENLRQSDPNYTPSHKPRCFKPQTSRFDGTSFKSYTPLNGDLSLNSFMHTGSEYQKPFPGDSELPDVPIEPHIPGYNDMMSGGLGGQDKRHASNGSDDATVSKQDLGVAVHKMPFRLIRKQELAEMDIFQDCKALRAIPDDWLTTVWGVHRALQEVSRNTPCDDQQLLGALAKRGGMLPEDKQVAYPEDLIPSIPEGHQYHDSQYWEWVRKQGNVWDEIYLGEGTKDDEGEEDEGSEQTASYPDL